MVSHRRRWLIPDTAAEQRSEKNYWEAEHRDRNYESTFSVGEDEGVTSSIVRATLMASPCQHVLIAGCGSRVDLQRALLRDASVATRVTATDFGAVIEIARERYSHPRLKYVALEDAAQFRRAFDVVVAVNVLVSDSDMENRKLVGEWAEALRSNGTLVMLAPLLVCGQELALLTGRDDLWACFDLKGSSWTETYQGTRQVEYTPLRLRRILREVGLGLIELRIVFLEGASSRQQARSSYGLDDEDLVVYEQLVVARRRAIPTS
jgi:SAM-dependent methyltransferase